MCNDAMPIQHNDKVTRKRLVSHPHGGHRTGLFLRGTSAARRRERVQRQAMRHVMQRAQWLTSPSAVSGLSPAICFRATRHSYPDALLVVSDVLTEAQVRAESGRLRAARRLDALAEQIAWYSGFNELVHLVRAYDNRS